MTISSYHIISSIQHFLSPFHKPPAIKRTLPKNNNIFHHAVNQYDLSSPAPFCEYKQSTPSPLAKHLQDIPCLHIYMVPIFFMPFILIHHFETLRVFSRSSSMEALSTAQTSPARCDGLVRSQAMGSLRSTGRLIRLSRRSLISIRRFVGSTC